MTEVAQKDTPEVVLRVRALLKELNNIHVPQGVVRQRMDFRTRADGSEMDNGLHPLLEATGNLLAEVPVDHPRLIDRLRGKDGLDITNILNDIATNPPDLNTQLLELRTALTMDGKPVLEVAQHMLQMAGRQKPGDAGTATPETPAAPPEEEGATPRKRRSWAQEAKPVDEEAIKESARDWNRTHGGNIDRTLHREAAEYDRDHGLDKKAKHDIHEEAREYDREHFVDDKAIRREADEGLGREGYEANRPKAKEKAAYLEVVAKISGLLHEALGAQLGTGGLGFVIGKALVFTVGRGWCRLWAGQAARRWL